MVLYDRSIVCNIVLALEIRANDNLCAKSLKKITFGIYLLKLIVS